MIRQMIETKVVVRNGVVQSIETSAIYTPKVNYTGQGVKWYDDSKLVKKKA